MGDFVKSITEMIWSESTLEMGFIKFFLTFVAIYVIVRAYLYITGGED